MPNISQEALHILIVLLPGFVTAGLVRTLVIRRPQTELDKFVEALLYSFVIYAIFTGVLARQPLFVMQPVSVLGADTVPALPIFQPLDGLYLLGLSVVLGIILAASINNDLHMGLLRWARVTGRTSTPSVWLDVFTTFEGQGPNTLWWSLRMEER